MFYALYLPKDGQKSTKSDSEAIMEYDQKSASYYWGLQIPVSRLPFTKASEIQDPRQVCLEQIRDWSPEFHRMLSAGVEDPDADMVVTQYHASTNPGADWRARRQRDSPTEGHPRIWIIGDAIHAMQPNRGQGGNTALADCADMLPHLLHLNSLAQSNPARPTTEEVLNACNQYEREMMPRAFEWVKKSGGTSMPNFDLDGWLGYVVRAVSILVLPFVRIFYNVFFRSNK